MSYLEIHDRAGTRWLPADRYFTIGRSLQNHVVLQGFAVSRNHARLVWQGQRALLEDLGSTYGTLINGQRVRGWAALRDGDRIELGDVLVIYREHGGSQTHDSVTPAFGTPRPAQDLPRNLVRCPYCGTANLKTNSVCYHCGNALLPRGAEARVRPTPLASPKMAARPARRVRTPSPWPMTILIVLLIVIVALLSLLLGLILADGPVGNWLFGILTR